jgi:hypothetical protein
MDENNIIIKAELDWLQEIINNRIDAFADPNTHTYTEPAAPDISASQCFYAKYIIDINLTTEERKIFLLALASEIMPEALDRLLMHDNTYNQKFSAFGGVYPSKTTGFTPTVKTALFLLGGSDIKEQMKYMSLFEYTERLLAKNCIELRQAGGNTAGINRDLTLSDSSRSYILKGEDYHYEYSPEFPASRLLTKMEWSDLVLSEKTVDGMKELLAWIDFGDSLFSNLDMGKNIQPGYRVLFHGPSGTGKTLTAALIGKNSGKEIYRIDLSQLISKYIGETEKNLEKIFNTAEQKNWILFFDEADALFTKRTSVGSSNDRFANQETAYLLQRIENCSNMVILASNLKANIDDAFTRRFQSIVYFPIPDKDARMKLWKGIFPENVTIDDQIDFEEISQKYDITGGSIVNVARFAAIMAQSNNNVFISKENLIEGIKREYAKMGRTI